MAIKFGSLNSAVRRTSGLVQPTQDLSWTIWVQYSVSASGGKRHDVFDSSDAGLATFWYLESSVNTDDILLSVANGVATGQIAGPALSLLVWYHLAVTYNATTHLWSLYINGVLIGTVTVDMTAAVAVSRAHIADDGTTTDQAGTIAGFYREWQACLTPTEIAAEMASEVAVRTANLFTDTPLRRNSDLADTSGNGHNWTAVNSLSTPSLNLGVAPTPHAPTIIPDLAYSGAVDLSGAAASVNVPLFANSSGATQVFNEGWWKYIPPAGVTFIYLAAGPTGGADPSYAPNSSIWVERVSGVLIPYVFLDGATDSQSYDSESWGVLGGGWFRVPVTPGTPIWMQVYQTTAAVLTGALVTVQSAAPPALTAPAGAWVIPDDTDGFPAALGSGAGAFYQFRGFPAGEVADTQPTGEIAAQGGSADLRVQFLDASWTIVATYTVPTTEGLTGIKSDRAGGVYVCTSLNAAPHTETIRVFSAVGALVSTHVLPSDFDNGTYFAVSRDGVQWFQGNATGATVHVYNLNTNTQLADLPISTAGAFVGTGDGYVAADGSVLLMKNTGGCHVERYNPTTGALISSYPTTTITKGNHFCFGDDAPGSFYVWGYIGFASSPAYIERIQLDGTHVSTTSGLPVSGSSALNDGSANPNAISNSCPIFTQPVPLLPPTPPTGTLVVTKSVVPPSADVFTFTAGGGLSPGSFTLANGQSETFANVTPGSGYSLAETVPMGWNVSYSVSNGSPVGNISVGAGETVTIQVLNLPPSAVYSVVLDCTTKIVTITGQGFEVGATITVQDPNGVDVGFTVLSFSSTRIALLIAYTVPGVYRVTVVNP